MSNDSNPIRPVPHRPVPIPLAQRLDDLRRGPLAVILWAAAAFGAWTILEQRDDHLQFLGLAQSLEAEVSSDVDGRIAEVLVEPFEDVAAGQPIARLDDATLLAQIESVRGEVAAIEAEIGARRAAFERERAIALHNPDQISDHRRFQLDEEEPRLQRLEEEIRIEADLVERARIEQRLERAEELASEGLAPEADRDDLLLRRDRLTARIEATRKLVSELQLAEAAAAARRAAFEGQEALAIEMDDVELEPLRARVAAAALRVEEIQVARRGLVLSAPLSGRVRRVLAGTGQALLAGEPVATVTGVHAETVMAYVPTSGPEIRPGTRVIVRGFGVPTETAPAAEGVIARLGPSVEQLPEQLWRDPMRPEFGRPVLIAGVSGLALVPGEVAVIQPLD